MIKLDKVKIITKLDYVTYFNEEIFEKTIKNKRVEKYTFYQKTPYSLFIGLDILANELILEFTGKILKDDYPKLINKDTIQQCFEEILKMGVCSFDVEAVMANHYVCKVDVCCDFECKDITEVSTYIKSNIRSYTRYTAKKLYNGNFIVERNVTTKGRKRRLTLYDKSKELMQSANRAFRATLADEGAMIDYFTDKARFEMNLNSMEQIREAFGVEDTTLQTILDSECNPIVGFLDEVLEDDSVATRHNARRDYINELILADCGYNLERVEATMRKFYAPGTKMRQVMQPFRELLPRIRTSAIIKELTKPNLFQLLMEFIFVILAFDSFIRHTFFL